MPGGRSRSDRVSGIISPSRAITIPFISVPSTNPSRIASPVGDAEMASCRCASTSSSDSTRKMPRWPPESAGLSTAGKPTSSAASRRSAIVRRAAKRGCGTPTSASRRRIATLCVMRCAVSAPIPGSPRASATAATTGTARSAETVSTPSSSMSATAASTASASEKSTTRRSSASASPSASGLRSTAATRSPSSFARWIARRWCRPAPTKRTVFTALRCYGQMLSVCCLSGEPHRLTALLPMLREVAKEIVVAVDDRADLRLLDPVASLVDRLFVVPYADPPERSFQWLHEQTSGDWVFRIDDDEVPSPALVGLLAGPPEGVTHVFVPRRWLWQDGWLDQYPWRPDWQLRVARRDAVAFPGLMHVPVRGDGPAVYAEDAPLYHLDLLRADRDTRAAKAGRYEPLRPGIRVAGLPLNVAYYLPEARDVRVAP